MDRPPLIEADLGDLPLIFFKTMSLRMDFKPLKPIFFHILLTSISSITVKVRHSNTLFLTISFAFPCHPLGALVRLSTGGGGHSNCNASLSQRNVQKQQSPCEGGGGLKFGIKKCWKNNQVHT